MSDSVRVRNLETHLIIHHGVANVLDQATEVIHIAGAVEEPCDLASLFQWGQVLKNLIEFPSKDCTSDCPSTLRNLGLLTV